MKLLSALLWSLAISTSEAQGLYARQISISSTEIRSTTSPAGTASNTPSQTSSESSIKPNGSGTSSAQTSFSVRPSISAAIDIPPASGTTTGSVVTSTSAANDTTRGDPIPLPLQPKITPAIGFAGAVLIITGLAYTLVGVKNQWLYSFLGVAYLVSLATTVLFIYCMNPPVSNGVQGAFLIAAIFAGCLAGGVALIFRDLVDGVGCLLGGFCLAMWFLCLKAGGLVQSLLGKAIFIGCMSAAVFSPAISSKTRKYGLIGSIPFSGATATILGIDCFSRAGLKEFWVYIWEINDNEFPLNTTTYPMTRGIKVEVAGIILLFLCGLTTQLKLAKVVQQRQEQKHAHRIEQEKDLEREETAAGQRVEKDIQNERVKWENIYGGDKSQTTIGSGVASVDTLGKSFGSVREKRVSGISNVELAEISPTRETYSRKQPRTTVTSASPEDTADEIRRAASDRHRQNAAGRHSARLSAGPSPQTQPVESSYHSLPPPSPKLVPLPFKIPGIDVEGPRSNQGSLSAIEESFWNDRRLSSNRGSGASFQRRSIGNVPEATISEEELIDGYESDKDSSVAATFDGLDQNDMSMTAMAVPRSPMDADFGQRSPRLSHRDSFDPVSPIDLPLDIGSKAASTRARLYHSDEIQLEGLAVVTEASEFSNDSREDGGKSGQNAATGGFQPHEGVCQDSKMKRQSATTDSQAPTIENLNERLPENVSKVVLQYRTNEWAKHLELAETPEQDGLAEPPSPGIQIDTNFGNGSSKELSPMSLVSDPDKILAPARPVSKGTSRTPSVQERPRTASTKIVAQSPQASPIMARRESERAASRQTSGQQRFPMSSSSRNSSAVRIQPVPISTSTQKYSNPISNQPLVESPIELPVEKGRMGKMKKVGSDVVPLKETLLTQRDSQLKSKARSKGLSSSSRNLVQAELEKVSSSQRKQQSKAGPIRTASRQNLGSVVKEFDSHQPLRMPNAVSQEKRADLLNGWHQSLRQEQQPQALVAQAPRGEEARMARLIQEKRQREFMAEQEQIAKATRDNTLDHMMRNGNMIDVHKQRLRNMQAGAKIL
ncbi:25S rRNA (cytosine-C(5))-methyltransferase [Venturia nashicola]|uniref:25S rRNA (Cytosine-C(5))-methyltransferase n=1 Tax=Venturia nashicola TaxID=86259 RepID=A0A4Z1P0E5_9PEZI|nr:25S rRNA (cytosine-C(5))-methyltransferase [Venturia nashicola]